MVSVLLRLIPYLYSFIKEMNRKDMERGTTQKQRARYRTVIAILLSAILMLGIFSGYWIHRKMNEIHVLETTLAREKERGYVDMTKFVPRTDHEQMVSLLAHKMNRAEFIDELALEELEAICKADPKDCNPRTHRTIKLLKDFLEVSDREKDNLGQLNESMEKEKAELRETLDKN